MKEGFYVYRNCVYYGFYREDQVSGGRRVSINRPERILTDHPFDEEDWAVHLWDNHSLLAPEYADLQKMLSKMALFMELNTEQTMDFSPVEKRLGIPFPKELQVIYAAIYGHSAYFEGPEHFLPLDQIAVEQGILVFFTKKRVPAAGYDLESGRLAQYSRKAWHVERGDICCYQFCAGRMITMALERKPVVKKGRCRGSLVSALDIERELESFCSGMYHLLPELHIYGIAVMYTEAGLLAWIRSNGLYGDIHAGAAEEAQLDALCEHLGQIAWR